MQSKNERYNLLYKQIESLVNDETDSVAVMANMAALIHDTFHFWWTGFYRVADGQMDDAKQYLEAVIHFHPGYE